MLKKLFAFMVKQLNLIDAMKMIILDYFIMHHCINTISFIFMVLYFFINKKIMDQWSYD